MSISHWWQEPTLLQEILTHVNQARRNQESVERCDSLCKAMNKAWNGYFQYRRTTGQLNEKEAGASGRTDAQAIREFVLNGLGDAGAASFVRSEALRSLAKMKPHIMNHDTLLRERYAPLNIAEPVRRKASDEHRQFENAFDRCEPNQDVPGLRAALLKKAAQLLFVVRSNIAHSEKTPNGPDLEKVQRDRMVSGTVAGVIEELFKILFDHPSHRLALYGTLVRGGANSAVLQPIPGQWKEGTAYGKVGDRDGFQEYQWTSPGSAVSVEVFSTTDLPMHFDYLDKFEGPRYERIVVPVTVEGAVCVCNIYQGRGSP